MLPDVPARLTVHSPHSDIGNDVYKLSKKKLLSPDEAFANDDYDIILFALGIRKSARYIYNQICEMADKSYPSVKRVIKLAELLDETNPD